MFDKKTLDDLIKRLTDAVPGSVKSIQKEMEKNFRTILESTFQKLDLVTRKEFDTQVKVLLRTRQKLEELENIVKSTTAKTKK